ncbi:cytochrome c oxidase assembly protein [Micromonospora sp. WMMD1076]|uniref:cytochrome c oxidase assembly protein n=1 Tax=Micromonospora sp. WMMD1076 TaxID=3016103 RepID=UPI00249BBA34|nr:cytochrome c oxidase assembly protein [Micromonospora sp. WMMD1076]WFF09737.1 cytochrome c oxidase assembly protein [Micromonospora sp. WMMD1076]
MTVAHAGHTDTFPVTALVPAALFWAYLAAALRLRDPGGPGWPHARTASFGLGALLLVTGLLLTAGGLWLLYLTPLYRATLDSPVLHTLVNLHFLLSGCLFAWSVAGPDPGPHRPRVPVRLVVIGFGVAAHATIAQLLYAGLFVDVPATAAELRAGATLMYYLGDLAEIALALALLATWRPEPVRRRRAARSAPVPAAQVRA